MLILFNDILQYSNAPAFLKSPALADTGLLPATTITFDKSRTYNCIGIGNCDSATIKVNGVSLALDSVASDRSGLYKLPASVTGTSMTLEVPNGKLIGRVAVGIGYSIGCSPAREPGYWSTAVPRVTLSGQVIPGVGGVSGRKIDVDIRYKFTQPMLDDIREAYNTQVGAGFPFFIAWESCETHRFPWKRLYGRTATDWVFQSSVNYSLYSKRLSFTEAY